MSLLDDIKPLKKELFIDLARLAGIDVSDWANYGGSSPAANPKYCYEWALVQPQKVVVLNLWHESMREEDGQITCSWDLRREETNSSRRARLQRFTEAIFLAHDSRLPIRVIVLGGDRKSGSVKTRLLDPESWTVETLDADRGHVILKRGLPSACRFHDLSLPELRRLLKETFPDATERELPGYIGYGLGLRNDRLHKTFLQLKAQPRKKEILAYLRPVESDPADERLATAPATNGWALPLLFSLKQADDLPDLMTLARQSYQSVKGEGVVTSPQQDWLQADEGKTVLPEPELYAPRDEDRRAQVLRQIRERRGQAGFRNELRHRYGDRCLVTGCEVLDVLEAAHISPYRGEEDNHPQNGLLLRADIHTLFDLDLLGIEPTTLSLELHPDIVSAYGDLDGGTLLCAARLPSREALQQRYEQFQKRKNYSNGNVTVPPSSIIRRENAGMTFFERYIGIDYSGAQTPTSGLKGLRVYSASQDGEAHEVLPPPGPKKYWTRRGIAEWLEGILSEDIPTIVGIDHGFSFPIRYFEYHHLPPDWPEFLDDFHCHWPTDEDHTYVDFVRDGLCGSADERSGNPRWRRLTEERAKTAKSVFHFDVQGSVAKSTHAGIPWLRYLRQRLGDKIHFWPFDGWEIPGGKSAIAEIYPSLWSKKIPAEKRTPDQHDAFVAASWLRQADLDGELPRYLNPPLSGAERALAQVEGWILGIL